MFECVSFCISHACISSVFLPGQESIAANKIIDIVLAAKEYYRIELEIVRAMNQAVELVVYLVTLIHLDSLSTFQINFVSMPSDDLCIESKLEVLKPGSQEKFKSNNATLISAECVEPAAMNAWMEAAPFRP